jgi:hypothetical protein
MEFRSRFQGGLPKKAIMALLAMWKLLINIVFLTAVQRSPAALLVYFIEDAKLFGDS